MPERLLLARHAQAVWNVEGRLHGQRDSSLTAEGIVQASAIGDRLVPFGVQTVFSSPLGRALRTAVMIADRLGAELIEVPELTELDLGEMAVLTRAEIEERFPGAREARAENRYGWAFPGGESYAQARGRARAALSSCGWEAHGLALIVTHEMIGRMLRAELRGLNPAEALALRHPLGAVFEIEGRAERLV
ncbi:histidine phosphatase family protein [Microbacterium sp. A93]|uniref:histidine phosphatase family protein n=1 Tax=Microbacterium sp. A93 TaxID=3450716 RepID=UPI003F433492